MKKAILLLPMLLIALASCVNSIADEDYDDTPQTSLVTINTSLYHSNDVGTRTLLKDIFTRLSVWVIDAEGNNAVDIEQTANNTGFGTIEAEVPFGEYNLVIVGHNGGKPAVINAQGDISFQEAKLTDTFLYSESIIISKEDNCEVSAIMNRAVAKFSLHTTEAIPVDATNMIIKIQGGGTKLNAYTGLAPAEEDQERNITILNQVIGTSGNRFSFFIFMPTLEKNIGIHAAAKNASGDILYEQTLNDVPMKVNQLTTYSGKFFKTGSDMNISITVDNAWGPPVNGEY